MPKFVDKTGLKYGRLLVITNKGKDHHGRYLWLCRCDCGKEKIIVGECLSSGKSNSCGCLRLERVAWKPFEDREKAILKIQYNHLRRRYKKKKMKGEILSFESFLDKSKKPCYYCGLDYSREVEDRFAETKKGKKITDTIVKMNGLDRINNNMGYTEENTVPCCKYCNYAKNDMDYETFLNWIKKVYDYNFRDGGIPT